MDNLLYIGQWQGFYKYGTEYGEILEGQEVEFRLFIEEYGEGRFSGRAIDWEGIGANGEIADVKGFINNDLISFTKQYAQYYSIDVWGNSEECEDIPGHEVFYEGRFDREANSFMGIWKIIYDLEQGADDTTEYVTTGVWRMYRQP